MIVLAVLMQLCMSKIVVVDDLGVTDRQTQDPEVARRVAGVLGDTIKSSKDPVLLSNSKGTKRLVYTDEKTFPARGWDTKEKGGPEGGTNHRGSQGSQEQHSYPSLGPAKQDYMGRPADSPEEDAGPTSGEGLPESLLPNPLHSKGLFGRGRQGFGGSPYEGLGSQAYGPRRVLGGYGAAQGKYTPFSFGGSGSFMGMEGYPSTSLDDGVGPGLGGNGMSDESRARRSFISLRMAQSKQKESMIQSTIEQLLQDIDQVSEKIQEAQKIKDATMSKLHTKKNHLRNLQINRKEVEAQKGRTLALIRLSRNELLKLSKMMDDQRSKLALLEDEEKIFSDRIRKYDEEYDMGIRELQLDETRAEEIRGSTEELERMYNALKIRNNQLLSERNKESAIRNKLELEAERLDRSAIDFI